MKVEGYFTDYTTTGECRNVKNIPKEEWREIGKKLQHRAMTKVGYTPVRERQDKETA